MGKNSAVALQNNLRALMAHCGIKSARSMAADPRCGVSDRHIGNILNMTATPSLDIVDRLARFFRVPTWALLIDGINPIDLKNGQVEKLIAGFLQSNPDGRELLAKIASREVVYAATVEAPHFPSRTHRKPKKSGSNGF